MKFTKEYIREQIDVAVSQKPDQRYIGIVLQTADPKYSFLISYDVHTNEIKGILERRGRTRGNPVDINVILAATRPKN